MRLQAVRALVELASFPRGLQSHLTPLLEDPDMGVRARAAATLHVNGRHEQAEAVLLAMTRQPDNEGRILGLQTLADVDSPVACDLAAEALNDIQPAVRYAAALAMATGVSLAGRLIRRQT